MLKKTLFAGLMVLGLALTAGCATRSACCALEQPRCYANETSCLSKRASCTSGCSTLRQAEVVAYGNFDPVVLRVQGQGTYGKTDVTTNTSQRKLLAMRASKMDAYRNLAERVNGTRIQGNTTVQNLAIRDDNIRTYVDSLIRGAKVISTRELGDGAYETTVELVLEPRLQHCLVRGRNMIADPACAQYTVHGEHPSQRLPVSQYQPRARYYLD